jgi:hypothetical protein
MNKRSLLQVLAIALILAACGRNEPASPALALDPPEAMPLAWHDASTLIVGYRGSVYRYDLNSRQLGQRLADSYDDTDFQGVNCFRPRGGRFAVHRPVVTDERGMRSTSAPAQQRFRHVPDWSQPDKYVEDAGPAVSGSTNPLDCSRLDYADRTRKVAAIERDGRWVVSPEPLLRADDGDAFVTVPGGPDDASGRILHLRGFGADAVPRKLRLHSATDAPTSSRPVVRSFQDSDGSYVIYETTSEFNANQSAWPLTAWRLGSDLSTLRTLALPPGPWVVPHGFFKQLGCFSCGCSCYAHFALDGAQRRMYAHVYGKSVDDSAAGIYELAYPDGQPAWAEYADGKAAWVRRVKGNFAGPVLVSPDGCRIAYSDPALRLLVVPGCSPAISKLVDRPLTALADLGSAQRSSAGSG